MFLQSPYVHGVLIYVSGNLLVRFFFNSTYCWHHCPSCEHHITFLKVRDVQFSRVFPITRWEYNSMYASNDDCKAISVLSLEYSWEARLWEDFEINHSLNLAKRVLTFSIQTNEIPAQTLNVRAFERNLVWLNWS